MFTKTLFKSHKESREKKGGIKKQSKKKKDLKSVERVKFFQDLKEIRTTVKDSLAISKYLTK